jgi:hypothetical protein
MKKVILITLLALAAGAQTRETRTSKAPAKPVARDAVSRTPPAGSERVGDGVWRYKDKAGKTWIYTRTPFGFSLAEEHAAASPAKSPSGTSRVVEARDGLVRFEGLSPFGKTSWSRPEAELNAEEKAALAAYRAASQSSK